MSPSSNSIARDNNSQIPLLSEGTEEEEQHYPQFSESTEPLYTPRPPPKRPRITRYPWIIAGVLLALFLGLLAVPRPGSRRDEEIDDDYDKGVPLPDASDICRQLDWKQVPNDDVSKALEELLFSKEYEQASAERLTGAVQVPTESFDDMGPVGQDPRWDIFRQFHDYLETTFPRV
jgi:Gly-Xaa carboxypeptidase